MRFRFATRRPAAVVTALLTLAACGSTESSSEPNDPIVETSESSSTTSATSTSTTSTTAQTSTTDRVVTTTEPPTESAVSIDLVIETVSGAMGIANRSGSFMTPEVDCAESAFAELPVRGRRALAALQDDPTALTGMPPEDRSFVLEAYLGCVDPVALRMWVAIDVVKVFNERNCVRDAWDGVLTTDVVVESFTYGHGLDDLPPAVVEDLAARVAWCVPDTQWWAEEVALEVDQDVSSPDAAMCLGEAYVATLGIDELVRRRILGVPLFAVPPDEAGRLDTLGRCGVENPAPELPMVEADPGTCLRGFGGGADQTEITDCEGMHNAEVIAVHDLGAEFASWPGNHELLSFAQARCNADAEQLAPSALASGWSLPGRANWEEAERELTCVILRSPQYESWSGPSGLLDDLPPPTTTSTTTSTTIPPATTNSDAVGTTTLPDGAQQIFEVEDLTEVGLCIYRAPALAGHADAERGLFEVACSEPHQWELFHVFDVADVGADYPGDEAVSTAAEDGCLAAFEAYVGRSYDSSRLYFVYYQPGADVWSSGDRLVHCMLAGQPDEMFTRSLAGSNE